MELWDGSASGWVSPRGELLSAGTGGRAPRSAGMEADANYYAQRELDERAKAREAIDWRVAAAHTELTARYEALAAVFGSKRLSNKPIDYL